MTWKKYELRFRQGTDVEDPKSAHNLAVLMLASKPEETTEALKLLESALSLPRAAGSYGLLYEYTDGILLDHTGVCNHYCRKKTSFT